jgi:hypothetical protein
LTFLTPCASAQTTDPRPAAATNAERDRLSKAAEEAVDRSDFPAAEAALRELTKIDAENFVPWYNLACALSMQGRTLEAGPALEKAIELGFTDLRQLRTDPHLANLRRTDNYRRLAASWNRVLAANVENRIENSRTTYGERYTYEKDDKLRLAYAAAYNDESFARAKEELARIARWWDEAVLPPMADADSPEKSLAPPAWVLIVLPTKEDYAQWAMPRYGDAWIRIPGTYSHDEKTLRSIDMGSTLRHEFSHVLHWRHMDQVGQRHQPWVQEGLCSLAEDIDTRPDGTLVPIPSYRTNQAKRLVKSGRITPWKQLFELDHEDFVNPRPMAYYAQGRAIFLWLHTKGKLRDWYTYYVKNFDEDPSGARAFELTFNKPLKDVEREFRSWASRVPDVPENFRVGGAVFPFALADSLDGVAVDSIPSNRRKAGDLRVRDVIVAINGQAVRDLGEIVRLLAELDPGDTVTIEYRRAGVTRTTTVMLVANR